MSLKSNRRPQQLKPFWFSAARRRRDRNVSNRGKFDKYDRQCHLEARQTITIDPIQRELDTDHIAQVNENHPGIHARGWISPLIWWSFDFQYERARANDVDDYEEPIGWQWVQAPNTDSDIVRPDDADHICDDDCRFIYCPANPNDGESGDVNRYFGDWMPYISSPVEKWLLPEIFDGWGYKVTTRP